VTLEALLEGLEEVRQRYYLVAIGQNGELYFG